MQLNFLLSIKDPPAHTNKIVLVLRCRVYHTYWVSRIEMKWNKTVHKRPGKVSKKQDRKRRYCHESKNSKGKLHGMFRENRLTGLINTN